MDGFVFDEPPARPSTGDFLNRVKADSERLQALASHLRSATADRGISAVEGSEVTPLVSETELERLLKAAFSRRYGWSEFKAHPGLASFFQSVKPKLNKAADDVLVEFQKVVEPSCFVAGLLAVAQVEADAAVRRSIFNYGIEFSRERASREEAGQEGYIAVVQKMVLAGLADVWSNIRKDTARGLFKQGKPQFLPGPQIHNIFEELVHWVEREGVTGNWQAVDGALHGINSILAHESDVQHKNPGHVLPDYLWTSVQDRVCAPMFRHGQSDIRANAVQIFRTFLTFPRAQKERTLILKTVLLSLRPDVDGINQLLPDFEAESVLQVVAAIVSSPAAGSKANDALKPNSDFALVTAAIAGYTMNTSSIVRQAVADVFRAFADLDFTQEADVLHGATDSSSVGFLEVVLAHRLLVWHGHTGSSVSWAQQECSLLVLEAAVEHLHQYNPPLPQQSWTLDPDTDIKSLVHVWYPQFSVVPANSSSVQAPSFEDRALRVHVLLTLALCACAEECANQVYEVQRIATQVVERLSLYLVSNIAAGKTEVHHQLSFLCAAWSKLTSPLVATPAARSEIALVSCTKGLCVSLGIYFDVYHQIWSQQAPDQQEESAIRELSSVVHPSEIVTAVKAIISFASGELAAVKQAAQLSLEIRLGVVNTVARAIACRPSLQRALSMTTRATEFCRRSFLQFTTPDTSVSVTFKNRKLEHHFLRAALGAFAHYAIPSDLPLVSRLLTSPHFALKGRDGQQNRHHILRAACRCFVSALGSAQQPKSQEPAVDGDDTTSEAEVLADVPLPVPAGTTQSERETGIAAKVLRLLVDTLAIDGECNPVRDDSVAVGLVCDALTAAALVARDAPSTLGLSCDVAESIVAYALDHMALFHQSLQSTAGARAEEPADDEEDSGSDWDETSSDEDVNATLAGADDGAREAAVVAFVAELSYGAVDWLATRILPRLADRDRPALLPLLQLAKLSSVSDRALKLRHQHLLQRFLQ